MLGKVGLGIQKNPIFLNNFWNSRYSWSENFTFPIPPPEKAMATHSSTLAWKIPWLEEPLRLQAMGSQRVGHDWATSFSLFTFMHWRRKWQPTLVFLPGESQRQEPGGLPSMGLHRVRHDWPDLAAAAAASLHSIPDVLYRNPLILHIVTYCPLPPTPFFPYLSFLYFLFFSRSVPLA